MLKDLSKSDLIINLMVRKEKFNKCRVLYGKVSLTDIMEDNRIDTYISNIVNPALTTESNIQETELSTSYSTETEKAVLVEATHPDEEDVAKGEATKTYTEQFKRGYFGKRKRF